VWAVALALVSVALVLMSRPAVAQQYFYTVQVGDTLSGISQFYGASVEAVADANGISNPDLIITGQLLSIPGASSVRLGAGSRFVRCWRRPTQLHGSGRR
jgi:LysM repeat protein